MSSVKFQDHTAKKYSILTQIGRFRTVTPLWIHWWLWNDAQSLKQYKRVALLFSQLSNSLDLPCFGLYAYFSNEPLQCILRWTGTLYLLKMAWLSKVAKSFYATILIYPISLDFLDLIMYTVHFLSYFNCDEQLYQHSMSACLSVCPSHFVSALSDVILLVVQHGRTVCTLRQHLSRCRS